MEYALKSELNKIAEEYLKIALSHVGNNPNLNEKLKKVLNSIQIKEGAEVPGFEKRNIKFGKFENREFVVMMTDIRESTKIINDKDGLVNMFLIFYVYAGIVAKIVDKYNGTSTEFLGDGVLNLFDTKNNTLEAAMTNAMAASRTIIEAKDLILNPLFRENELPRINLGIGIDHGITIVTQFGYRSDTDLKAFGKCVYNASKLSKGFNTILVSTETKSVWPTSPNGKLSFSPTSLKDGLTAYSVTINGN